MMNRQMTFFLCAGLMGLAMASAGCGSMSQAAAAADAKKIVDNDTEEASDDKAAMTNILLERPQGTSLEQDRWAILQQAGEYRVTFEFLETLGLRPGYDITKPYRRKAKETVVIVEDTERRISLQHILKVPGMGIIKHWRQTWVYEPTMIYEYKGNNVWVPKAVSPEEAKGAWSQTVSQVDDSPRYAGVGKWVHSGNLTEWESRAARPLPRREYTKRSDYHILVARNRHTLAPNGWVHEQDNYKWDLDNETEPVIAREVGFNVYSRTDKVDFNDAYKYWEETKEFWAAVREHWATIMDGQQTVTLQQKWKKKKLFRHMFELAKDSRDGAEAREKAITSMKEVLSHFLSEEKEVETPEEPTPADS